MTTPTDTELLDMIEKYELEVAPVDGTWMAWTDNQIGKGPSLREALTVARIELMRQILSK